MIHQTAPDTTDEVEELLSDEQIMTIKQKSVAGATSFFFRTAFLQGIGLISAVILSAFFSPEDFGVYGFVIQIIGLLIFFSDIGLAASLIQKKDKPSLTDYRTVFTIQQVLSWLIMIVIVVILATGVVQQKVGQVGAWVLLSLGISFPLVTLKTIPSIMLERKLEFSKLVIPQIFEQIIFHGLLIFLVWNQMGVMAYTYAILARSVVGVIIMWLIQPWKIGLSLNKASLKSLLGFGVKFQLNDLLARIKDQLFYLLLAIVLPLREFGFIQWAKNWSMYPYNLTVQNVMAITFPTFSRLQSHRQLLKKAIEKSIFFISAVIFPILVGMSVFIIPLTELVDKFQKWQPARLSFILFALSIGWAAISSPLVNTLNAIGKINQSLKLMVMWTVLTWILTPLFMWKFGFNGVAMAAFVISFTSVFAIKYLNRVIRVNIIDNVWRQLLSATIMALVGVAGMSVWSRDLRSLLMGVVIVAATYCLSLVLLGGNRIKQEVASLFKK